jgi:hypothetical protein
MTKKIRPLGTVKLTQIQPHGMIVESPSGAIFDSTRRTKVAQLDLTAEGVSAIGSGGEKILDIHHSEHPNSRFKPGNSISIGFTSHYKAMRSRFGSHIVDGSGGENVIIEFPDEVWSNSLGQHLLFENPQTGAATLLDVDHVAKPCNPFIHFVAASPYSQLPPAKLKEVLLFLDRGRRGFLLTLNESQEKAFIHPGDEVFVVSL